MTDTDFADLFVIEEESVGSFVKCYAWRNYRIEWDAEYDCGELFRLEGKNWVRLTYRERPYSFAELASIAVRMEAGL